MVTHTSPSDIPLMSVDHSHPSAFWQDDFEAVETMEVSYTSSSGEKALLHSCCDSLRDSGLKWRFHKPHMGLSTYLDIQGTQMGILTRREFA